MNDPRPCGDQSRLMLSFAMPVEAREIEAEAEASLFARIAEAEPRAIDEVYRLITARFGGSRTDFSVTRTPPRTRARRVRRLPARSSASAAKRACARSSSRSRSSGLQAHPVGGPPARGDGAARGQPIAAMVQPDTALAQQQLARVLYAALDRCRTISAPRSCCARSSSARRPRRARSRVRSRRRCAPGCSTRAKSSANARGRCPDERFRSRCGGQRGAPSSAEASRATTARRCCAFARRSGAPRERRRRFRDRRRRSWRRCSGRQRSRTMRGGDRGGRARV